MEDPYKTPHFEITQSEYDPLKDYYHTIVFRKKTEGIRTATTRLMMLIMG